MIGSVIGFHEVNKADMCLQIVVLSMLMLSNIFISVSVNRPLAHPSFGIPPNCHFDFVPCIASTGLRNSSSFLRMRPRR